MRYRIAITGLLVSLLITGCGSNQLTNTNNAENSIPKAKDIKSDFVFMSDFIASLKSAGVDCTGYVKNEETLIAKEEGSCSYNGKTIYPVIFGDSKTTPELVNVLKGFGSYWLTSNNWAITVDDEATARDLQTKLGVAVK